MHSRPKISPFLCILLTEFLPFYSRSLSKFAVIKGLKKGKNPACQTLSRFRIRATLRFQWRGGDSCCTTRVQRVSLFLFFFFLFLRTDDGHACTMVEGKQVGRERKLCGLGQADGVVDRGRRGRRESRVSVTRSQLSPYWRGIISLPHP